MVLGLAQVLVSSVVCPLQATRREFPQSVSQRERPSVGYRRAGEHMGQDPMTPPLAKLSVGVPSDVASCEADRAWSKAMPDTHAHPSRSRVRMLRIPVDRQPGWTEVGVRL